MTQIQLSIAIGDYDQTRDVISGRVAVEGVELIPSLVPPEEVFHRFSTYLEWDISEVPMGRYASMRSQNDNRITAIPVFVSRVFRHSMIYVRDGGGITRPEQLRGTRIGVPEWAQTAAIYMRGLLMHDAEVPLESVHWVQAGVNMPGREEMVKLKLPENVTCQRIRDRSLNEMLLAGDLDAVLSARPPAGFGNGIRRLYGDFEQAEEAYYRKTGIFPIMHVLAARTEVLERHPWVAMNLMKAFEEAKQRSIMRLSDITASHFPLAWIRPYTDRMRSLFGEDFWPYGVAKNRTTLEAFLGFACEQGVCHRRLSPEELFSKQTLTSYKV